MYINNILSSISGFSVGYFSLQHILLNHSKTTQVSIEQYYSNEKLRNKIINRHNTMKNILKVDMNYAKRLS